MPNATSDKSSQGISPGFAQSNFLPAKNIWSNPVSSGKRDILPPRGSDEISPSNSGSLPATTDDPWAPSNPWNAPDGVPTRSASGSTSPSHTRDDRPGLQIPTGGSVAAGFFDAPQSGGGTRNSSYPRKLITDDDKDGSGSVGPYSASYGFDQVAAAAAFRRDRDGSGVQDGGYLGLGMTTAAFVPSSRDSSMPPSRQSHDSGQDVYSLSGRHTPNGSAAAAAAATAVAAQNQRQQSSSSFVAANNRAYGFNSNGGNNNKMNSGGGGYGASSASRLVDEDLAERYRKSLKLGETSNNGMAMAMPPAYSNLGPQHQPYPPQPGHGAAPPWLDGADGLGIDGYADPYGGQFVPASKKSPTDRVAQFSAAAAGHHQHQHHPTPGSPRTFVAGNDMWARPAPTSRDPRAAMAALERTLPPQFIQAPPPHHLSYYHPAPQFYPASYSPQYPTSSYDAYQFAHFGRQPINVSPYSAVPPYMPASPRQQQQQQHMQHMRDLDPAKGMRSMVLEEFKGHKNHGRYTLREIYGHVVEFSGDQHGSRFIQSKLETANSDEKDVLFKEIGPNALQLMKDVFGNYVIQKFFAHGNQIQKKVLAGHMKGKMVDLSLQMYSCRVVQKALEHVLVEQQAEMAKELEHDVLRVIKDQNGNHVVQKIIELVPRQYVGFIIDSVRGQVSQLASHLYGCRVIQRLLEFGSEQDKRDLLEELHAAAPILVTDQYGNYVAQHIIQLGKPEDRSRMIGLVTGQVLTLSKHKFASNVVEKCIQHGTEEERGTIQKIITDRGSDPAGPLYGMMKDQYGNYVIQKMYMQLQGAQRTAFLDLLLPLISLAKKANSTRQITALERLIYGPPAKGDDGGGSSPATMTAMSGPAALRVDVASAAPTPSLTNGQNSPQSVSPSPPTVGAVGAPSDPAPQSPPQPPQQPPKVDGHGIEPTGPEVKVQVM